MERVKRNSNKACKYIKAGMTRNEVAAILGKPDGSGIWVLVYGTTKIHFDYDIVDSVSDERRGSAMCQ